MTPATEIQEQQVKKVLVLSIEINNKIDKKYEKNVVQYRPVSAVNKEKGRE